METLTISPKFQVVIPKAIRERLGLSPGQKVQALVYGNRIELIPLQPAKHLRGFISALRVTQSARYWWRMDLSSRNSRAVPR